MSKIILITGANKGIGYEAARQLASKGCTILLGARDPQRGETAAATLRADGNEVHFVQMDVTNEASLQTAADSVAKRWGKLDVLVNNAGVDYEFDPPIRPSLLELTMFKQTFETNVFGVFSVIRTFLPLLRQSESPQIINVSSTLGSLTSLTDPNNPFYGVNTMAYNASKSAVNAMTVALSKDLSADNIHVNSICPGWVQTDMGSSAAPRTVEQGATVIVQLAMTEKPPTGTYFDEAGAIPW